MTIITFPAVVSVSSRRYDGLTMEITTVRPTGRMQQDHRREPSLGAQGLHLTTDRIATADGRSHVVEHLGQVTTDLAVDVDGLNDPFEVLVADAGCGRVECVGQALAEPGLDDDAAELLPRAATPTPRPRCRPPAAVRDRCAACPRSIAGCRPAARRIGYAADRRASRRTTRKPSEATTPATTSPTIGPNSSSPTNMTARVTPVDEHRKLAWAHVDPGPVERLVQRAVADLVARVCDRRSATRC